MASPPVDDADLIQQLRARDAIGRLVVLYGQLLDDQRFEQWGELFTDDAIWRIPSVTFRGRAAIVEGVAAMEPPKPGLVKHLAYTPVIDFESSTTARVWTDLVTLSCREDRWLVSATGRYHDLVALGSDGRWRFVSRETDVAWPPGSEGLTDVVVPPAQ